MKIAVYGKGGIGKSTLAANLSAAWADQGRRVLHIGCDPKSDATRLLLGRRAPGTVLDYIRKIPPGARRLSNIILPGYGGVQCVEAGGPEPGVGCAGRGILSTFAVLEVCDAVGVNKKPAMRLTIRRLPHFWKTSTAHRPFTLSQFRKIPASFSQAALFWPGFLLGEIKRLVSI